MISKFLLKGKLTEDHKQGIIKAARSIKNAIVESATGTNSDSYYIGFTDVIIYVQAPSDGPLCPIEISTHIRSLPIFERIVGDDTLTLVPRHAYDEWIETEALSLITKRSMMKTAVPVDNLIQIDMRNT